MNEFSDAIERYKKEMMKLAASQGQIPSAVPVQATPAQADTQPPESSDDAQPSPDQPQASEETEPQPDDTAADEQPFVLPVTPPRAMDSTGSLQVKAFTALDALPVTEAQIVVSKVTGDDRELIQILHTDLSGGTVTISLPTVAKALSESPGNKTPFAMYDIEVFKSGFIPIISRDVPIFSGVKSVQNFELIAFPEFEENKGDQTIIQNTEPELSR